MTKILIINLKKLGDVFQTGHIVNSLREQRPNIEIHLLCYKESYKAAKILRGISKVHTLDRHKLVTYYSNNIYSDGLSLNLFEKYLTNISNENFNMILNYSNDRTSTFLASFIKKENTEMRGISFSSKQTVNYSGPFAIVLNDIITQHPLTPYNFNDCYHQLFNSFFKGINKDGISVKTNKTHDISARNNIDKLRALKNNDSRTTSIIGIQLAASCESKEIPSSVLENVIEKIIEHPNTFPILLIAPNAKEKEKASKINKAFNDSLVSVEADFIALPSVLKNIDLLLTPDTSVKHLADLTGTISLEISLGHAPFLKQGSIQTGSGIISEPPYLRSFRENSQLKDTVIEKNKTLEPDFIFDSACLLLGLKETLPISKRYCLYNTIKVVDGTWYMPIAGKFEAKHELKRVAARAFIQKITQGVIDENLVEISLKSFNRNDIFTSIEEEKKGISHVTKDLLSTLRSLIQCQENKSKAQAFIENLEKLLSRCFETNLAAIPTLIFRAKVESLTSSTMDENFKEVEATLYELKDNLQSSLFVLKRIEEIGADVDAAKRRNKINKVKDSEARL